MSHSQARILVVDDERNIRNNLRALLEAEGYGRYRNQKLSKFIRVDVE